MQGMRRERGRLFPVSAAHGCHWHGMLLPARAVAPGLPARRPSTTYVVAAALSHALRITTVLEYSTCMHWAGVRRYDRNGEALWKIVFPIPMGNVALAYLSATPSLHALHKTPENASCPLCVRQTCIGASDRIFDHCFCLSSAATTPLTLEPMGSPALLTKTQALSSNLTTLPSGRCHFFAVRTTTA